MSDHLSRQKTFSKPLRLWPGVLIVLIQWLLRFVLPILIPSAMVVGVMGGLAAALLFVVWWLFFSRAAWSERIGGVALMGVVLFITKTFLHVSIATNGMGMTYFVYAIPSLCLAFLLWALTCRRHSDGPRWGSMAVAVVLACGMWTLVRSGGFTSDFNQDFAWRWSKTAEDRLIETDSQAGAFSTVSIPDDFEVLWSGFRGLNRDGIIHGVHIETDWLSSPPTEIWRRSVGPSWSSFAVLGELCFTQEQRGDDEVVSCYNLTTGEPVWRHSDNVRFWEANAGAGPRGTPTLSGGRLFTFGATGILNALNALDGSVIWSKNPGEDAGTIIPLWGFSSSPLVINDVVVVAAVGTLVAYDLNSGELRWIGPKGGDGYSSPHHAIVDGVEQVLLPSKDGVVSLDPEDGIVLWNHSWQSRSRIVQPAFISEYELLISAGESSGIGRIKLSNGPRGWTTEEVWRTNRFKPYFSDLVIHNDHAYGIDGSSLVCIDTRNGNRKWKGGRYGSGQLFLLADQDVLLILSEEGELALVEAKPDKFTELASMPAIEGKTWNHPVLVGDILLIRNAEEMVAFRLALVDG
jgi:outer membrane protein assembly factor BamB